jgi:phosphoglycerate dehydrogenase-like enzyme
LPARIAVVPQQEAIIADAVEAAGGVLVAPDEADGIIWTDPRPQDLGALLKSSKAGWIQLPFAGIEAFFEAGVVDPGRTWTCAKGIYGPATAEHALTLILAAARRIHHHVRESRWEGEAARRAGEGGWRRLKGSAVLILGTGGIGGSLNEMLRPLGARVLAVNRSGRPLPGAERTSSIESLPELLPDADFVVVAAALTPETTRLIDARMLGFMRPDAWLVNVARGRIVDTDALVDALGSGALGGAALDVTDPEPLPEGHPLWGLENAIVTPHVANTWAMALPELAAMVERNVAAFAAGEPLEGGVEPALGY